MTESTSFLTCIWLIQGLIDADSEVKFLGHLRESKTVLDSGFHGVGSGFQVLDSSLRQ